MMRVKSVSNDPIFLRSLRASEISAMESGDGSEVQWDLVACC